MSASFAFAELSFVELFNTFFSNFTILLFSVIIEKNIDNYFVEKYFHGSMRFAQKVICFDAREDFFMVSWQRSRIANPFDT